MFQQILNIFKEHDWSFTVVPNRTIAILGINGENNNFRCIVDVKEEQQLFIIFSIFDISISEEKRSIVSDFLARVNYNIMLGNFEIDLKTNNIIYKTNFYYGDMNVTKSVLEHYIITNIVTMDKSSPILIDLLENNTTLEEAYQSFTSSFSSK